MAFGVFRSFNMEISDMNEMSSCVKAKFPPPFFEIILKDSFHPFFLERFHDC